MPATLLLADDSVTIHRVIQLTFANDPIRIVIEPDGAAALTRLTNDRPDIILAGIALPSVDGYELATRVKQTPALAAIPVLLLAGAFEPVDEARARRTGCDGVLVKPLDPDRLTAVVRALLAGRRPDHLWPADMPRLEPTASRTPDWSVAEPGPATAPAAVEADFESGLDDLDLAFSRLDPSAAPHRLDANTVSDFQRDIQELRSTPNGPVADVTPGVDLAAPISHLPVEEALAIDPADLQWDLPSPSTVTRAIPLPVSFPDEPVMAAPTAPVPVPEPAPVPALPVAAPIPEAPSVLAPVEVTPAPAPVVAEPEPEPEPAPVAAPEPTPAPESAPVSVPAPPSLATAFAALLAAEQARPTMAAAEPAVPAKDLEEMVRRVVTRVTDEVVRKVVEELDRRNR